MILFISMAHIGFFGSIPIGISLGLFRQIEKKNSRLDGNGRAFFRSGYFPAFEEFEQPPGVLCLVCCLSHTLLHIEISYIQKKFVDPCNQT